MCDNWPSRLLPLRTSVWLSTKTFISFHHNRKRLRGLTHVQVDVAQDNLAPSGYKPRNCSKKQENAERSESKEDHPAIAFGLNGSSIAVRREFGKHESCTCKAQIVEARTTNDEEDGLHNSQLDPGSPFDTLEILGHFGSAEFAYTHCSEECSIAVVKSRLDVEK